MNGNIRSWFYDFGLSIASPLAFFSFLVCAAWVIYFCFPVLVWIVGFFVDMGRIMVDDSFTDARMDRRTELRLGFGFDWLFRVWPFPVAASVAWLAVIVWENW